MTPAQAAAILDEKLRYEYFNRLEGERSWRLALKSAASALLYAIANEEQIQAAQRAAEAAQREQAIQRARENLERLTREKEDASNRDETGGSGK